MSRGQRSEVREERRGKREEGRGRGEGEGCEKWDGVRRVTRT
jgi:hypothetical protein